MNIKWIIIWGLSLVAAFLGGQYFGNLTATPIDSQSLFFGETSIASSQKTENGDEIKEIFPLLQVDNTAQGQSSLIAVENNKLPIQKQLQNLQNNSDAQWSLSQTAEVYSVVKDLNSEEILRLLSSFTGNEENKGMVDLLYSRLLELDPILSLNYLADTDETKNLPYRAAEALKQLANTDPNLALAWYQENIANKNLDPRNIGLGRIFESYAANDLYGASDIILSLSQRDAASSLYGVSRSFTSSQEYADYLSYLEDFNKPYLLQPILRTWARSHPQEMADHLALKYTGGEITKEHKMLLTSWSFQEPIKAANWYISVVPSSEKLKAINTVANKFQGNDSQDKTLSWLDQIKDVDTSTAIDSLIKKSIYRNIDFSIANLDRISNPRILQNTVKGIHRSLNKDDPARAEAFKLNSKYAEFFR